jgi:4-hydroxythreonine-4-phosphate dehydrogenase
MSKHVRIGITAGDINGIGPEVTVKALRELTPELSDVEFVLTGPMDIWAEQPGWNRIAPKKRKTGIWLWNPEPDLKVKPAPGSIRMDASRMAAACIRAATQACLDGYLDALVTAPICKEGFHRAGIDVPGHTEMLAELTGTRHYAMMLFGGPLRVVLATRHVPIAAVPKNITAPLIKEQTKLTAQALGWMGLRRKRVAVCGLNPHAGENGDIGREDVDIILPAVKALRRSGLDVHGPLPGDTVFHEAAAGHYDAVVAMYHDQGLAPLKLIAFDRGVNLTLGLPIVRTSPDHGTAFAIAGQNKANPASMIEAIRAAVKLARRPNPWKRHVHA